ncbi:MAG TPA: metallophosphoesterase [Catalimonadaceae bacterium]|nr:metallophosphoesterase [Catalimonadaceae bacterium]
MRIIALGDTHGRPTWKQILAKETYDRVIFIGDYFDAKEDISPADQKQNFREILDMKRENPDKVVLLFGNHDYHYLPKCKSVCAGYQFLHRIDYMNLLEEALDQDWLQICFVHDTFLFVHAGVTRTWARNNGIDITQPMESINSLFRKSQDAFRFTPGVMEDSYGDEICQSPIWVRPDSLMADPIPNFSQVVGHTQIKKVQRSGSYYFIDTLGTSNEYFVLDNGIVTVGSL